MKYASEYYGGLNKFAHTNSNMNRLCKDIERWCKTERFKIGPRDFDYHIMLDEELQVPDDIQDSINALFLRFTKEMADLSRDQANIRKYGDDSLSTYDSRNFMINWGYYYEIYESEAKKICPNMKMLANAAVRACYEYYPNKKNTKFMWVVVSKGILQNIKQIKYDLPIRDDNGEFEYLGRKYSFAEIVLEGGFND